jgi:hypothetical protein
MSDAGASRSGLRQSDNPCAAFVPLQLSLSPVLQNAQAIYIPAAAGISTRGETRTRQLREVAMVIASRAIVVPVASRHQAITSPASATPGTAKPEYSPETSGLVARCESPDRRPTIIQIEMATIGPPSPWATQCNHPALGRGAGLPSSNLPVHCQEPSRSARCGQALAGLARASRGTFPAVEKRGRERLPGNTR